MIPGPQKWATNSTYASGVDTGDQNKYEPSSGRVADGFERRKKLATGWENMFRWRLAERIDSAAQFRIRNWLSKTIWISGPTVWGAGAVMTMAAGYRKGVAGLNLHQIQIRDSNAGINRQYYSRGGEAWRDSASVIGGGLPYQSTLKSDLLGNASLGVNGAASGLYYSAVATPTTWAAWAGTVGENHYAVDYDEINGYWITAESTVPKISSGTTVGVAITSRNTNAIIANTLGCLKRSSHGSGKLYPQDPGNDVGLFLPGGGGANLLRSIDALSATWSTVAAAPFMPAPADNGCLNYSFWGSRWGVLTINGPASGANVLTFAYSDDNGDNWVELNDAFDFTARGFGNYSQANDDATLLCDGYGHWVAVFNANDGSTEDIQIFASADNGLTWQKVFVPMVESTSSGATKITTAWYGDGAFWIMHAGISTNAIVGSLRAPE